MGTPIELTPERLRELLPAASIVLDAEASDRDDAVRAAGAILRGAGAVDESYIAAMLDREAVISTYVGEGVALPHATVGSDGVVHADGLALLRVAGGIDWDGQTVTVVIAVAAQGRQYIGLISQLAAALLEPARAAALREATSAEEVYRVFA
jgi:PTS system mannitol-specific IIA component